MKAVILVDGSESNFEKMVDLLKSKNALFIKTQNCDEPHEYKFLKYSVSKFSQSDKQIMLVKFSGRDSIVESLGGDSPEMILSLSYNKNSRYYTECPIKTFLDLVTIFEKGD